MPLWLLLNPQFAMVTQRRFVLWSAQPGGPLRTNVTAQVRAVYKLNFSCAALLECYGPIYTLALDDEVLVCVLMLFADAVSQSPRFARRLRRDPLPATRAC
jgi:hypothetical protein